MSDGESIPDALFAIVPIVNRNIVFFLASDLRSISIRDDGLQATALSAFALRESGSNAIRLRHPLSPKRFLSVSRPGAGGPNGCVLFNGLGDTPLDIFYPATQEVALLPGIATAIGELAAATACLTAPHALLGLIRDGRLRPGMIEAVLRVMPQDELADLAQHLMEDDSLIALLATQLPDNAWFSRIIPELARWNHSREAVPCHMLTSPASDEFAGDWLEGHGQVQAGLALTACARATVRPSKCACLLACAKNEGPYLLDWIAYHLSIGFEHIFVYTNNNQDGSDTLLEALSRAGIITLIHNEVGTHSGPQYKAHSHCLSLLPQVLDYRWCAILDLDEYFCFEVNCFANVQDFFNFMDTLQTDAIALCWQLFAARRSDIWRDEFVPARFHLREPAAHFLVKSIFKPRLFWHSQPHFPYRTLNAPFHYRTETGTIHHHDGVTDRPSAHAKNPSAQIAWINHYIIRTAPEALCKLDRGYGDWNPNDIKSPSGMALKNAELLDFISRTFINLADKKDLVEDRRIMRCARAMAETIARLRAMPGVSEAEVRIKARFRLRLSDCCREFANRSPEAGEPRTLSEFRNVVKAISASTPPVYGSVHDFLGERE